MAPTDLLLGRRTFEILAGFWPKHVDLWPTVNHVTKYALSSTMKESDWQNSVFLTSVEAIENLKNSAGPDLSVWGSSELVKLLLKHNLVDELWLNIYPVILGKGKKRFDDGLTPAAFTLVESTVTPKGVIMAHYRRAGEIHMGTIGE
jgi:dihydrofolate reductase